MPGKCDRERKEETKLSAPVHGFFPPRDGRPSGRQRQEDGGAPGDWHNLSRCVCGEGQRLDCSPGSANALTRVSRDTLTPPDLQMLGDQKFSRSCTDGARSPPSPELTEDGCPPPASHLSPGPPPAVGMSQTTQVGKSGPPPSEPQAGDKIPRLPSRTLAAAQERGLPHPQRRCHRHHCEPRAFILTAGSPPGWISTLPPNLRLRKTELGLTAGSRVLGRLENKPGAGFSG